MAHKHNTYEIGIDTPPTEEIDACLNTWQNWRTGAAHPWRSGTEILLDLPPSVLDFVNVVDVQADPRDFIFQYWGASFVKLLGCNLTGKSYREIKPKEFAESLESTLEEVML